ncbi:phospholipase D-like domain-containing protein [Flavobacterium soyae]|uniref:phospholipase D-like domain-containing protein n=1 Tax=Flavobacterium soyae TaxID=2903098 RepID=UPI001E3CE62C|nr:phospholipase D-like domain-containing protein [Flavobacterium soyae]MCD9575673.1 phospholipase D-like domain-containing protein [Flavobacterium soyae]
MINPGNGSQWGIKPSGTDLTLEIHSIIDNANDFVIVCGYNFSPYTHPSSIIPRLVAKRSNGAAVLIIMPPNMWGFGNRNHTLNIQHLVNNGIGVILNSKNHSKWLVSDYGYYYGSLNYTPASMHTKIEVVSICDVLRQVSPPWWMTQTKLELLQFAYNEVSNFNRLTTTLNLGIINSNALNTLGIVIGLILRFNPEIGKIRTTLLNYENARINLSMIVDKYFSYISFEELEQIWKHINRSIYILDKLAAKGNEILLKNDLKMPIKRDTIQYNRLHDQFIEQINKMILTLSEEKKKQLQEGNILNNIKIEEILKINLDNNNDF